MMMRKSKRWIHHPLMAGALLLAAPGAAHAHGGHAGDHGWLAGAAEPLLGLDHFLAGLFVLLTGALATVAIARRLAQREGSRKG